MRRGWSLESSAWEDLRSVLGAVEWSSVRLRTLDRDSVPQSPGIYLMVAKPTRDFSPKLSQLMGVVYVGIDRSSLRRRFLEHCRKPKPEIQQAVYCFGELEYWFATIEHTEFPSIERQFTECFGPPANLQAGTVTGTSLSAQPAGRRVTRLVLGQGDAGRRRKREPITDTFHLPLGPGVPAGQRTRE